jgi:hypothetical protein
MNFAAPHNASNRVLVNAATRAWVLRNKRYT